MTRPPSLLLPLFPASAAAATVPKANVLVSNLFPLLVLLHLLLSLFLQILLFLLALFAPGIDVFSVIIIQDAAAVY